ncbi:MAG: BamA/TamA family outer membrane protein [Rhizobiales bacterium]|nr:BamA/TamA family outer membrane protein [Hyphomicrobiales bacterium]
MAAVARRKFWQFASRCIVGAALLWPCGALAFDFFGLFGEEKPPAASQQALPYSIAFDIADESSKLKEALQGASTLYKLRQDAPPDGETLMRRAEGDLAPLLDALWGAGYYNATLVIEVAGVPIRIGQSPPSRAAAAAEAYRARDAVPIHVKVEPGPLFRLRAVQIVDAGTGQPFSPTVLPHRAIKIAPGDPARAADIRAARAALIDHFRAQSHPLAKVTATKPVVYHRLHVMDVAIAVEPGPKAPFGTVTVAGKSNVDPAVVRSHIYIEPGDPYSPTAVAGARKSVLKLPAISSVRIREAQQLDAGGRLPTTAEVTDRKPRVIGFSARYSTLDGPAVRTYWQHRNLFGGAESLRLEGEMFIPPRFNSSFLDTVDNFRWSDLGGRLKANFVKPGLEGTRNDLLLDAMIEKDRTGGDVFGGYTSKRGEVIASIRHRFSDTFSAQIGLAAEKGETSDTLGTVDYQLFGIPASVTYDSTDRPLDPTKGVRVTASMTPYPSFLGSSVGLLESKVRASAYYALDEEARIVLAGRVALGSITGDSLGAIPANHRFYAGGGGSVRGYRYRSLSPLSPAGQVIGGRSLFETSFETRIKLTDTIGLVPFFDMGNAFQSSYPDFKDELRYAAGVGLRYYTAVGPIRLDAAFPLNPRNGDNSLAIYIGIGQAF